MIDTVLDKCKFLALCQSDGIQQRIVPTSLKTYADTLLFYYLGHLSINYTSKNILEIGIGGSTIPLKELAGNHSKTLYLCDPDKYRMDLLIKESPSIPNPELVSILDLSNNLKNHVSVNDKMGYIHIDGDKNFLVNCNDLRFAQEHLAAGGIICQDDYGNNKWPTVTNAVHANLDNLEILLVGDSSVWLTSKEHHQFWINYLNQDQEFNFLKEFLNIHSSSKLLGFVPEYFFMNGLLKIIRDKELPDERTKYFVTLFKYASSEYLKMPYGPQSTIGSNVFLNNEVTKRYLLTDSWLEVKEDSWGNAPQTFDDIVNLPNSIKDSLTKKGINIFEYTLIKNV
jgi:hypothetical protein